MRPRRDRYLVEKRDAIQEVAEVEGALLEGLTLAPRILRSRPFGRDLFRERRRFAAEGSSHRGRNRKPERRRQQSEEPAENDEDTLSRPRKRQGPDGRARRGGMELKFHRDPILPAWEPVLPRRPLAEAPRHPNSQDECRGDRADPRREGAGQREARRESHGLENAKGRNGRQKQRHVRREMGVGSIG